MSNSLEGEWKNFTFRILSRIDLPEVAEHLEGSFYQDEPLCKAVRMSESREAMDELNSFVADTLDHNLSFAAFDKTTGKIAGVRLTMRHGRDLNYEQILGNLKTPEMLGFLAYVMDLDKMVNLFDKYGVDEYADFVTASVGRAYRHQGLVTEMYVRALKFLKESGFSLAKSSFTSPYTRKAVENLGFTELVRKYFRDWRDHNGVLVYPDATEEEYGNIMTLPL